MLSGIRAITHCNTMRAIILSAGRGSRMGKITDSVPKSLLPIGELTILTRLILQLLERGVTKITISNQNAYDSTIRDSFYSLAQR